MTILARARVLLEGDTIALTKALQGAEAAMRQTGERMSKIGKTLSLKVTAPLIAIGGYAFKTAADFDASLRKIEGLVGVQRDVLDGWKKDIRSLAVEYGSSAEKAADALFYITSAGLRGDEAMKTLEASLKASAIGMGDVKSVADAATSAMNAYGAGNLSATRATEILTAAVRAGKLETETLAPVLGNVISTAAALGVSFEQVAGMLAVFSRTGTDAAMGATSLQAIMAALLDTSSEGERLLDSVGLSLADLRDVAAGPNGLVKVFRMLDEAFVGQTDKLKQIIPNIRAFRGVMNALAQDADTVNGILNDTANSVGIVDEAFAVSQGPMFRFRQAMAAIKETFLSIGDAIVPVALPALLKLRNLFTGLSVYVDNMDHSTKSLIVTIAGLTAVVGPLLVAVGGLLKLLAFLKLGAVVSAFYGWAKAIITLIPAVNSLASATALLQVAMGPTGWIVLGVGAIIAITTLWLRKQREVGSALNQAKYQVDEYTKALDHMNMSQKQIEAAQIRRRMSELSQAAQEQKARLDELEKARLHNTRAGMGLGVAAVVQSEEEQKLRKQYERTTEELGTLETQHRMVTEALRDGVLADRERTKTEKDLADALGDQRTQAESVAEALTDLHTKEQAIKTLQAGLGTIGGFDAAKEGAEAYRAAIGDLAAAGVSLDEQLGTSGLTLRDLISDYQLLLQVSEENKEATQALQAQYSAAQGILDQAATKEEKYAAAVKTLVVAYTDGKITQAQFAAGLTYLANEFDGTADAMAEFNQLIEAAKTPAQKYADTMEHLKQLLADNAINQKQFNIAAQQARTEMEDANKKADELGDAIEQTGQRGVDAFVDFATGAGNSFSDFVNSAIRDLERLIIKILFVKALSSAFGGGGSFFAGLFAKGGFIPKGQVGIVGEKGPEIIQAGARGITVEPIKVGQLKPAESALSLQDRGEGGAPAQPRTVTASLVEGLRITPTVTTQTAPVPAAESQPREAPTKPESVQPQPEATAPTPIPTPAADVQAEVTAPTTPAPEVQPAMAQSPLFRAPQPLTFPMPQLQAVSMEPVVQELQAALSAGPDLARTTRQGVAVAPMASVEGQGGGDVVVHLDTSSLPPRPKALTPDALATDDWWRRAYSGLKADYDDRGGP